MRSTPTTWILLMLAAALGCRSSTIPDRPDERGFRLPPERYELDRTVKALELFSPVGNIRVREAPLAALEKVLTVSAGSEEEARAIADGCKVSIEPASGGRTRIALHPPVDCPVERVGADSRLSIPRDLALHMRTRIGLIDTTDYYAASAVLETDSGTILSGPVRGQVRAQSRSGSIVLQGGFVEAQVTSTNGDLDVQTLRPGSKLEYRSTDGSCALTLPRDLTVEIRFRTRRGAFLTSPGTTFETLQSSSAEDGWREQRLILRGGDGAPCRLSIESETGDLAVRRVGTGPSGA